MNGAIRQASDIDCLDTISHVTERLGLSNCKNNMRDRELAMLALTRRFHRELSNLVQGAADAKAPVCKLTPREALILKKASEGKTARQTASELFVSEHTVNKQRSTIMQKLGTRTLAQTVSRAETSGLI